MTQCPFVFCPCFQTTDLSLHWRKTCCPCPRSRKLPLGWSGSYRNSRPFVRPCHRTTMSRQLRLIGSPCAPSWTSSSSAFTSLSWHCMLAPSSSSGPAGASPNHANHFSNPFPDWVTFYLHFPMMCWREGKVHFADRIYLKYCTCKMMYWPWLCFVFLNNALAKQNNRFKKRKQYVWLWKWKHFFCHHYRQWRCVWLLLIWVYLNTIVWQPILDLAWKAFLAVEIDWDSVQ